MPAGKIFTSLLVFAIGAALLWYLPLGLSFVAAILISAGFVGVTIFLDGVLRGIHGRDDSTPRQSASSKGEVRLAASLQEAVIIVNDQQQIEHINPAARQLFTSIETGDPLSAMSPSIELAKIAEAALNGKTPEPFVYEILDPVERYIRVTGSALKSNTKTKGRSRAVIVFYDVTDLERANALRADFLANASHELKTPIASLLGYIETLNGHAKDDPEARTRFLGIMQQQAERMQRLISDILSLRRIELSEHKAPTETADLYLAFLAAKQAVAPMAQQKNVRIKYKGAKEILVTGQQDELVQLILNIIDNAVKMNSDDSKIKITSRKIENWQTEYAFPEELISDNSMRRRVVEPPVSGIDYAELKIRDSGPGFKPEHLPRLSERFYRVAGDRSSKEKGTGLGLAIVKHIVMRHRGGLLIETAEGSGTEFTILMPLSPIKAQPKFELAD